MFKMKFFLYVILLIVLVSCSKKVRTGLSEDRRNHDESSMEKFEVLVSPPMSAIYVYDKNIHEEISFSIKHLCDSVLGNQFVTESDLSKLMNDLTSNLKEFEQPNPETIISVNFASKNQYSLKLKNENILTFYESDSDLEVEIGDYNLLFRTKISLDSSLIKTEGYGIQKVQRENKDLTVGVGAEKYSGINYIDVYFTLKNNVSDKIEYYSKRIESLADCYTLVPLD